MGDLNSIDPAKVSRIAISKIAKQWNSIVGELESLQEGFGIRVNADRIFLRNACQI